MDIDRFTKLENKLDEILDLLRSSGSENSEARNSKANLKPAYNKQWLSTPECCELLGVTATKLYKLRSAGRLGKCNEGWRQSNIERRAKRPTYQWHIERCQERLGKPLGFK